MLKAVRKRFDIQIATANQSVTKTFDLDKNIKSVKGVLFTTDREELMYARGSQKIEINKDEEFPDGYETKLLMSGLGVPPNERYYDLGGVNPGNGTIKIVYQDTDDSRTTFTPYRVSLYVSCEMEAGI